MIALKKRRIVLIGGAGFIGHHLALRLKEQGAEVSVIDGLAVNHLLTYSSVECTLPNRLLYQKILNQRIDLLNQAGIPLYVEDARDYHRLSILLTRLAPHNVVHLAAISNANSSNKDPHSTFDHSLRTLENALDSARGIKLEHFIYFSSSMAYGNFPNGFVSEETPCNPIGIYGALKLAGEKIVHAYHQVFGLPYTIIRPSALYGEGCVSRRVTQIFIENALQGKEITINGTGQERLDFTYVADLAQGVIAAITNEEARNQTFNLTYGESRSIAEVGEILSHYFPNLQIKHLPKDDLTPERGTLSVEKARKLLGYEPRFPLEVGLPRYVEWYRTLLPGVATS